MIIRRLAKKKLGNMKLSKLKEHIRTKGLEFTYDMLERYTKMLSEFNIVVLRDMQDPRKY